MAYTKRQQRKKEKSERLRGEGEQIKFIDLKFERASCRVWERKKKARHFINCMFMG